MEVVFSLVGVSVVLVLLIALALLWSFRSGQFDDLEGPAWRILMDDDESPPPESKPESGARTPSETD